MYCDDSIQGFLAPTPWWESISGSDFCRGRLIKAFLPHVDQVPSTLTLIGRTTPTEHTQANYTLEPMRIKGHVKKQSLPVAACPVYGNEVRAVYRAKKRPAIIISEGGADIPKSLTMGKPKWQTAPTILVIPCYGGDEDGKRAGFNPIFVERIRRCEYPQLGWDILPISTTNSESILRFDHIQPIGKHHDSIELTDFCLSSDAMGIIDEWIYWLITGYFEKDSLLYGFREEIRDLEKSNI